jgi:putative DNA methylase
MHKWWARRPGSVFRSICLYSLIDDPDKVEVHEPGEDETLDSFTSNNGELKQMLDNVDLDDPGTLWPLYKKDVRVSDKKVLDPFAGGGTSLGEASRFGAEVDGYDLNPVAWFISKKEMEAHQTDPADLEKAYQTVKEDVASEIQQYYKTTCPNDNSHNAEVMYYLWVKEIDCVSCGDTTSLFKDYRVGKGRYDNKGGYNVYCPECDSIAFSEDWRSETECGHCGHKYVPQQGNVTRGGNYTCTECGQKYGITDAIQEQDGFDLRMYALEYYCPTCDENGLGKNAIKDYKTTSEEDLRLLAEAEYEWESADELSEYIPNEEIPYGAMTAASSISGNDVFKHGYEHWSEMFNPRQKLSMGKLLGKIETISNKNMKEYLLLAFSQSLNYNSMMGGYHHGHNSITNIFKSNSFDPPQEPAENNLWGLKHGTGSFTRSFEKMKRGVEYAHAPTDRYIEDGETKETEEFGYPLGANTDVKCGDAREIEATDEYDLVLTDPPYYDNIIYSELSDYFYVWQKRLLKDEYDVFEPDHTPRTEIVANPEQNMGAEEFEEELREAFTLAQEALKDDGHLVFTYHHSDSESWGELLEAVCDAGFVVTATYPVTADVDKLTKGESVSFDIIVVARPAKSRQPISWNSLRRNIVRTAKQTHDRLTENRELSEGDIGVIEMGRAFHEYSKHHGEVQHDNEIMSAKAVVDEIYGIIQEGSNIGSVDVFLDLLEMDNPTYNDLNMLTRGTNANTEEMKETILYRTDTGDFILGTWDDQKRLAYIQGHINDDNDNGLTPLEKAQFLRHRYEHGKSIQDHLDKWTVSDDLRELCKKLADASGDEVYRRILRGDRTIDDY